MGRIIKFAIVGLLMLLSLSEYAQAKRVALIIANARYANATTLANPIADARIIAASLKRAGFDTVDVRTDVSKAALESELRAFGQKADGAEVALVYYAGHGIEAGGQNYLIPVDAALVRDRDLDVEATRLDTVLLMGEGARMRLVVLDACRNNPFAASMQRTMRSRAVGRGLAAVEPEGETLVVYAAKAGATAADGEGSNSPFAEALAKRLPQPGLEISLLFRAVRDDVLAKTGRTQEPFTYGSLSGNAFYFVGPTTVNIAQAPPPVQTQQPVPIVSAQVSEALFWQGAITANSEGSFREYLRRYPQGEFAELARQNIAGLARPKPAPVAATAPPPPASGGSAVGFAMPSLGASLGTLPGGSLDPSSRFAFVPSQAIRQRAKETFFTQIRASNPAMGDLLAASFSLQDVFATLDKGLAPTGLGTTNLADSLTMFIETLRGVATSSNDESLPSRAQATAMRRQMALILQASPDTNALTPAKRQEYSDALILNATFMSMADNAAKSDPAARRTFADGVADMAKSQFGIDLRALKLTQQGYQF
jgi:Caspase domain